MRRLAATKLAVLAVAVPMKAPEPAAADCASLTCVERVNRKACSQKRVIPCIRRAALTHRVSYPVLLRVAYCESTLNPYARNGVHAGLFQFRVAAPSTWATTRYADKDPYSAKWASLAAASLFRAGRANEWSCK